MASSFYGYVAVCYAWFIQEPIAVNPRVARSKERSSCNKTGVGSYVDFWLLLLL